MLMLKHSNFHVEARHLGKGFLDTNRPGLCSDYMLGNMTWLRVGFNYSQHRDVVEQYIGEERETG